MAKPQLAVKWPFPRNSNRISRVWIASSTVTMAVVGGISKIWGEYLSKVTVHNRNTLLDLVENRPKGKPLLTVFNHHSCLDDPMLWGALKWNHLTVDNQKYMRWSLAAADVCFKGNITAMFCALGRVAPVVRGGGVYQRGMDFVLEKLNMGEWVHTFPEGRINVNAHEFIRLKWGVGRLVAEANTVPIVLPMWHVGMDSILKNQRPYIPRIGKRATLLVGDPMDFTTLMEKLQEEHKSPKEMRKQITDKIQEEFKLLKEKAEQLHYGISNTQEKPS